MCYIVINIIEHAQSADEYCVERQSHRGRTQLYSPQGLVTNIINPGGMNYLIEIDILEGLIQLSCSTIIHCKCYPKSASCTRDI